MITYTWGFLGTYTNPPDAEIVQDHTPQHLSQVSATFETCKHDIDSYTNSFSQGLRDFTNSTQMESISNHVKKYRKFDRLNSIINEKADNKRRNYFLCIIFNQKFN